GHTCDVTYYGVLSGIDMYEKGETLYFGQYVMDNKRVHIVTHQLFRYHTH
ncbi:hypothetical protein COCCADRAFT_113334, partial [Bipolaris zeicola 26-R-13]